MRGSCLLLASALAMAMRCSTTDIGDVPPAPNTGATTDQTTLTFAMNALFLGEADRAGGYPSTAAWRQFGYDLDGLITTATSTNACTLVFGAPTQNQVDGLDGIDNAWGSLLIPILQSADFTPTPSPIASSHLAAGDWTLQIQITGLSTDPHQNAIGLGAQVFVSGPSDGAPAFDSTTDWPVLPSSLRDGTTLAGGARVRFEEVYVTDGTLVARGATEPITMPIAYADASVALPLRVYHPTLTFDHVNPSSAAHGTIAGILATQDIIDAFRRLAARVSTSLCGPAFDGIANELSQAQDILGDATNAPGVPCDAISIGIGFTAKLVANPTKVGAEPAPLPDLCDAGADAPFDAGAD